MGAARVKWIPLAERRPGVERVLVCRLMPNGNQYVDVVPWWNDAPEGLAPVPTFLYVTHWMPLPELPTPLYAYDIDGD